MTISALTCFSFGGATRLYYLDGKGHVNELSWQNRWVNTDITASAGAPPSVAHSALTCFSFGGATRLYYLDGKGHVNELSWQNRWVNTDITASAEGPSAAANSALTCFGDATRLYYWDSQGHVNELSWQNKWVNTDITASAGAPPSVAHSALTCFSFAGATRLYYLDNKWHVNELSWQNRWVNTDITASAGGPSAAAGSSALTCFSFGGATRLYYLDFKNHVNELSWQNRWVNTDITASAGGPPSVAYGALTCFSFGGATRLYYLDGREHVNELSWQNRWVNTDITASAGGPLAASNSALTCFGDATRLYYWDSQGHVNELSWQNKWVNTVLWPLDYTIVLMLWGVPQPPSQTKWPSTLTGPDLSAALTQIAAAGYFSSLAQYNTGQVRVNGPPTMLPLPWPRGDGVLTTLFTMADVVSVIKASFLRGVPSPDKFGKIIPIYIVITPRGGLMTDAPNSLGEHSAFSWGPTGTNVIYAYVGAQADLNDTIKVATHEIVEAIGANGGAPKELCDDCQALYGGGVTAGIGTFTVASYFDAAKNQCVAPPGFFKPA